VCGSLPLRHPRSTKRPAPLPAVWRLTLRDRLPVHQGATHYRLSFIHLIGALEGIYVPFPNSLESGVVDHRLADHAAAEEPLRRGARGLRVGRRATSTKLACRFGMIGRNRDEQPAPASTRRTSPGCRRLRMPGSLLRSRSRSPWPTPDPLGRNSPLLSAPTTTLVLCLTNSLTVVPR
jgi:hypothetical protein